MFLIALDVLYLPSRNGPRYNSFSNINDFLIKLRGHIAHVQHVYSSLSDNSLTLKVNICRLITDKLDSLDVCAVKDDSKGDMGNKQDMAPLTPHFVSRAPVHSWFLWLTQKMLF